MKINIPVRFKNPWFWVGLCGTILAAMGVSPEMFTSWDAVWEAVVLAVLGVFVDPTTSGISDSKRALSYKSPVKE